MTFHVTACSTCDGHWITETLRQQDTATCPACGTTHNTDRLKSLADADDRETACEHRSQLLANNAGETQSYADTGTYTDLEAQVTESIPDPVTDNTDTLDRHRDKLDEHVSTTPVYADAFEHEIDIHLTEHREQYSERAANIAGMVGKHEQISRTTTSNDENNDLADTKYPAETIDTPDNDPDAVPAHPDTGLTLTTQTPVTTNAAIHADQPVTQIWDDLTDTPHVQTDYINAAINACRNRTAEEIRELLDDIGITDTPTDSSIRWLIRRVARGHDDATWKLIRTVRNLGTGTTTVTDILAATTLLRYTNTDDDVRTLTIRLNHDDFITLTRRQREHACHLISELSKTYDVRLITGRVTQAYLRTQHQDDLPSVSDWTNTQPDERRVTEALNRLDADGTQTAILRTLHNEPGETTTYHELYAAFETSRSRVRQCISELADLELVETHGPDNAKKTSLTPTGRDTYTAILKEHGRQTTLTNRVSGTPKSQRQRRVTRTQDPDGDGRRPEAASHRPADSTVEPHQQTGEAGGMYETAWLSRADHDAIAATGADSGGVTVVDTDVSGVDSSTRFVSFDEDRGEAVVSVHATNPLDWTVSFAVALASPRFVDSVLDERTLNGLLDEVPAAVLRNAREIGYLTDDVLQDAGAFRDMLVKWGRDVAEMTRKLRDGEYEDRDELLSDILCDAHGLAGSVVHVLDAVGVDLIRDVRVPSSVNSSKLEALAESITHSLKVQSRYESFAAYRQLFEAREEKREASFSPVVDAADPVGGVVGSMVVRGGSASRLRPCVEAALQGGEVHDDAPEFEVPVRVRGLSRSAFAETATRVLDRRNIRVTREAVSVLYGLVDSPFGVAEALLRLGEVSSRREIRADEVRFAVSTLDSSRVLSGVAGSVGAIVVALLRADGPVSQAELADRAGVSSQTVRNHRDALVGVGVVRVDSSGWRAVVSFREGEERCRDVYPDPVGVAAGGDWLCGGWCAVRAALAGGEGSGGVVIRLGPAVEQQSVSSVGGGGGGSGGGGDDGSGGSGAGSGGDGGGSGGVGGEVCLDFSGVSIRGAKSTG